MHHSKQFKRVVRHSIVLACVLSTACSSMGGARIGPSVPALSAPVATAETWLIQNAHVIRTSNPEDADSSDLQSFGDAIGDARIVALAEPTHGSGTVFDMKMRLVKYLHQEKGFTVLMHGAGIFGAFRMDQLARNGSTLDALAPDELADTYAKSIEGRRLLQYIDNHRAQPGPLLFTGMDSHQSGKYARVDLIPMLEAWLASKNSAVPHSRDWPIYTAQIAAITRGIQTPPAPDSQAAFYGISDKLEGEICTKQVDKLEFPNSPGLWCRIVKSLHNQADRFWKDQQNRDVDMAANVHWLAENPYAGRKIIIWADLTRFGNIEAGVEASLGSELKRLYGNRIYVAGFTASAGADRNPGNLATTNDIVADRAGSIEALLHSLNKENLFVDTRHTTPPAALSSLYAKEHGLRYVDGITTTFGKAYDGLFYHQTAHPLTMNR